MNRLCSFARRLLAVVYLCVLIPTCVFAQSTNAKITGIVTDPSKAIIRRALVTAINADTGVQFPTTTNNSGIYVLPELPPGNYRIEVASSNFKSIVEPGITLHVQDVLQLNFEMALGSMSESVTVDGSASGINTTDSSVSTVINQQFVQNIPLNGRNFTELLTLTPGVSRISVGQNASGGGGQDGQAVGSFTFPSVNGQRNRSNLFLVDGTNDLNFQGGYMLAPSIDDIQEFKVQSHNDLAEFGQVTGGIINVDTKSGTNEFHGTAYEFIRNDKLDARNYFALTRSPFRQNQYGATIGGPLSLPHIYKGKDRTFFFFSYEGFSQSQAAQTAITMPTQAEINGNFSSISAALYNPFSTREDGSRDRFSDNIIPGNLINPFAQLYAKTLYPLPSSAPVTGGNLYDQTPQILNQNSYSGRIDQAFGERDHLFGRISNYVESSSATAGFPGALNVANIEGWNIAINESHVFTRNTIMGLHFGRNYGRDTTYKDFNAAPSGFATDLINAGMSPLFLGGFLSQSNPFIPIVVVGGYAQMSGQNLAVLQMANTYEGSADITQIFGRHTFKAGASVATANFREPISVASINTSSAQTSNLLSPNGTGDGFASFLLGVPSSAQRRDAIEDLHNGWVNGWYAQDQIKVSPRLTLNVGVRWDVSIWPVYGSLKDGQGYVGDMDLSNGTYVISAIPPACSSTQGAPCIPGGALPANVVVTKNKNRALHNTDWSNWQGRVGIAYRVSDGTSLHVAYGRFFDNWNSLTQISQNVGGTWPSVNLINVANLNQTTVTTSINNPIGAVSGSAGIQPAATPFNNETHYFDPNFKTPYTDDWNLSVEQNMGRGNTLSLAYVGSHSGRLDVGGYQNTARVPGGGAASRPYPYIVPTAYDQSTGNGNYHALQTRLSRTSSSGLTYLISYTWSKSIDVASSGSFGAEGTEVQDPYNPRGDRSVSGFDLTNNFSGSVLYDLPFGRGKAFAARSRVVNGLIGGWQINGIVSLASGTPYDVTYNADQAQTGNTFVRANVVGNPKLQHPNPRAWFNKSALAIPALRTFGDMGRNSLRSDWYKDLDLSLFRSFPVRDRAQLQFRAEAFNLTNTPVFSVPDHVLGDTAFGSVQSTFNAQREIQFAVKVLF